MAMIGHNAAVAEVGKRRHEVDGTVAFMMWLGVHATLMTGVRPRVNAFMDWAWDYFSDRGGPPSPSSAPTTLGSTGATTRPEVPGGPAGRVSRTRARARSPRRRRRPR